MICNDISNLYTQLQTVLHNISEADKETDVYKNMCNLKSSIDQMFPELKKAEDEDALYKQITFDESYTNCYGTTELYFIAPVEFLKGKYKNALSAEIRIDIPVFTECKGIPGEIPVEISPTRQVDEGEYEDYDWEPFEDIPMFRVFELIFLAEKKGAKI